ncbi:ABC transporter permease [Chryseoglobus frigidaquae]|nr:ABC transporter permease [Microcella frigidaquae]NHN44622.1 ABC transporter permease [Microcella frigidaquae]
MVVRSWKAPIAFAIFSVLGAVLFIALARGGDTTYRLSNDGDAIVLPAIVLPADATGIVTVLLMAAIAVYGFLIVRAGRRIPLWLTTIFAILFLLGFLTWAAAGSTVPLVGLLAGALTVSTPLIFGSLGGVISERVGVVNIAIEGQLLAGAFTAALVATATGSAWAGLIAAMVAGAAVSAVLAAFAIKYLVDQVIVGVVLNVLVIGLTSFLYSTVMVGNPDLFNKPARFERLPIPLLSDIPVIGPIMFNQSLIVYAMFLLVPLVWFGLFKTRWGLRLRAVGEHPKAADTVGIKVAQTRFWNVLLAGVIVGGGGAFFTLVAIGSFTKEMTNGAGFIALAAVIFGQWNPIKATLAALLFGFATNLQSTLSIVGSPVPSEFMLMLPYLVTIFAVAGLVGFSRPPAASGKPYVKS